MTSLELEPCMRRNQTDPETFWSGKLLFKRHTLTLKKYTSLAQFFWTATAETRCPSVSWVFKWRGRMSARTITAKPGTSDINSNQFDWSFSSFAKPLSASPHFDYSTPTSLFMFVLKKWLLWSQGINLGSHLHKLHAFLDASFKTRSLSLPVLP